MDKDKSLSMAVYGGAAISSLMVIISMFFNYTLSITGAFNKSGFGIFSSKSGLNITLLVLSLILSACVAAIAVLRLLGMLDGKMFAYILAALGLALLIVSIILIITIVKTEWANQVFEYKRGIGVILNLIFSVLAALFCLSSLVVKKVY